MPADALTERSSPAHRSFVTSCIGDPMPVRLVDRVPQQLGRQHVVAIGEDVRADGDAAHPPGASPRKRRRAPRLDRLDGDARGGTAATAGGPRRGPSDAPPALSVRRPERVPRRGPSVHRRASPSAPAQASAAPACGGSGEIGRSSGAARPISGLASTSTARDASRMSGASARSSAVTASCASAELPHRRHRPDNRRRDRPAHWRRRRPPIRSHGASSRARAKSRGTAQRGVEPTARGVLEAHRHEHAVWPRRRPAAARSDRRRECRSPAAVAPRAVRRNDGSGEAITGATRRNSATSSASQFATPVPPGQRRTDVIEPDPLQSRQRGAFDTRRPRQKPALLLLQAHRRSAARAVPATRSGSRQRKPATPACTSRASRSSHHAAIASAIVGLVAAGHRRHRAGMARATDWATRRTRLARTSCSSRRRMAASIATWSIARSSHTRSP